MKRIFFVLFVIAGMNVFAIDNEHTFVLGTSFGLLHGQSEKIVFIDKNSDDKLSQLLWDLKPLMYAGVDLHYNWQSPAESWGLFADAALKAGLPDKTGVMEDRDWLSQSYPDFLTHYSVHDNRTNEAILIDINVGASFTIFENFLLKPFISYGYMKYSWVANGGSLLYPSVDGDHRYLYSSIEVITYDQTWNTISAGISFSGAFNRYFTSDVTLKVSPFIWCNATDDHILRKLVITEKLKGGFFIEPSFALNFTPKDWFSLGISVAYKNISGTRGDGAYDFSDGETADLTATGQLGVGYSAFDLGITAKFKILQR